MHTELAHLGPEIPRELVRAIDLLGAWRDLLLSEISHGLTDGIGGLAEIEIKALGGVRQMDRFCLWAFWSAMLPLSSPDHQEIGCEVAFKTHNWS
jgi:hypothetical protein